MADDPNGGEAGLQSEAELRYNTFIGAYFAERSLLMDIRETIHTAQRVGVQFLLTDLDLAMTLVEIAKDSGNPETSLRNRNNARRAYDAVTRHLERLSPVEPDYTEVTRKLAALRLELERLGEVF